MHRKWGLDYVGANIVEKVFENAQRFGQWPSSGVQEMSNNKAIKTVLCTDMGRNVVCRC